MHPPRFFAADLAPGIVALPPTEARHALQSLRLRAGATVALFDGRGASAAGQLQTDTETAKVARRRVPHVTVRIERVRQEPPPARTLALIIAACKGPRLDYLVEKCTELGVDRLMLTNFERSVVRASERHIEKHTRTAIEACKQCGRNRLPEIRAGVALDDAIAACASAALLVADPRPGATSLPAFVRDAAPSCGLVAAVVGPEGGLTEAERTTLKQRGGVSVGLAEHILRVETAGMTLAAQWAAMALRPPSAPQ